MIHESVVLLNGSILNGNIEIGEKSSVWFNAVLRGDIEPLKIGISSNIQDCCVLHSSKNFPLTIGDYVSVGHAAVLHGCNVEDNCLIGMNATVLNGAVIKKNSIVGAGAVVTENTEFPEDSLILGVPAKHIRTLQTKEIENIKNNAKRYVEMAKKSDRNDKPQ